MKTERVLKKNAIKAYKAFGSDLTCIGFQYEVGKEYHHKGKLELCKSGFHVCPKLVDCFSFYPFSETKTRVAEVLVWGKVKYEDAGVKLCASNIKVVRELPWSKVLFLCNSGNQNTGYGNSGDCNSGSHNSGSWNSGDRNSGDWNSGNHNSGCGNSGDWNSGSWNSGNWNSGNWNSGNHNSGNTNSGCGNTGNHNTGNHNSGSRNIGDWNIGDWNNGSWNRGNWNSGYLNTSAQKYSFIFNKQVEKSVLAQIEFPKFMRFILTEWIPDSNMSRHEKARYPKYATTGGYLKEYAYKEAFRKSFEEARRKSDWPKQRQKLLDLPNFDAKVFEEISGITPEELGIRAKELADKPKTVMEVTMADIEKVFGCKIKIVKDR